MKCVSLLLNLVSIFIFQNGPKTASWDQNAHGLFETTSNPPMRGSEKRAGQGGDLELWRNGCESSCYKKKNVLVFFSDGKSLTKTTIYEEFSSFSGGWELFC